MIYILNSSALEIAAKVSRAFDAASTACTSTAQSAFAEVKLEAVPTFISVLGLFDVEYRHLHCCELGLESGLLHKLQDNCSLSRWQHLHRQEWTGVMSNCRVETKFKSRGEVLSNVIELETQPVGLVRFVLSQDSPAIRNLRHVWLCRAALVVGGQKCLRRLHGQRRMP